MLMPTPLDMYIMDSPLPMPMLLAVPTMLELSLEPPMLPLPILDMLDMLDMLDIMPMLVLDTLVLAILEPTLDKLRRNWIADDLNSSFNNKLPKH